MSKQKSGFLSALGVFFQIAKALVDDVLAAGGGDEDIRKIQTDSGLRKQIVDLLLSGKADVQHQLEVWKVLYKKDFNIDLDISTIVIPPRQPGFDRLIVVAQGLTPNGVYDVCAKRFPCWRWTDDLDKAVSSNDRNPKDGAYAIWVRDRQEADEENKNLSADDIKQKGEAGITLLERLLYELKYYDETGQHLDLANVTLCAGSRYSGGGVPYVCWSDSVFEVVWCCSCNRLGYLRSRSAVSS